MSTDCLLIPSSGTPHGSSTSGVRRRRRRRHCCATSARASHKRRVTDDQFGPPKQAVSGWISCRMSGGVPGSGAEIGPGPGRNQRSVISRVLRDLRLGGLGRYGFDHSYLLYNVAESTVPAPLRGTGVRVGLVICSFVIHACPTMYYRLFCVPNGLLGATGGGAATRHA
jgi:hypothetical protein